MIEDIWTGLKYALVAFLLFISISLWVNLEHTKAERDMAYDTIQDMSSESTVFCVDVY